MAAEQWRHIRGHCRGNHGNLNNKIRVTVRRAGYSGSVTSPATVAITQPRSDIAAVEAAIDASTTHGVTASDPIPLAMVAAFNLGNMTAVDSNWQLLLAALQTKGKYVELDLSACAMSGTVFAPYKAVNTGEDKVVSLVLPNAAQTITAGTDSDPTFKHFTALTTVSGASITAVSDYAFVGCITLAEADFPVATSIGEGTFLGCAALASVSIPEVVTVTGPNSFLAVGIDDVRVTVFNITIKAGCTFNDDDPPDDLKWDTGDAFKTVYDGATVGGVKAGGTYACATATGVWTYAP